MSEVKENVTDKIIVPEGVKGLIFDMDGTLVDSTPIHYQAWLDACAPFGVSYDYDFFITLTGRPVLELSKDLIQRFDMDIEPIELVRIKESLVEKNLDKVVLVKAVNEVLEQYKGKLPMAVGTGASRDRAQKLLTDAGIIDLFDAIVTSDDVDNYKPHPDTFLKAAKLIDVAPEDCIVFEDGHLGIDAAITAGMQVIDVKPFYE